MSNKYLLGASRDPESNFGTLETFVNRMSLLIDNRNRQGEVLRELIESMKYNLLPYCEEDKQGKLRQDLDALIRRIK